MFAIPSPKLHSDAHDEVGVMDALADSEEIGEDRVLDAVAKVRLSQEGVFSYLKFQQWGPLRANASDWLSGKANSAFGQTKLQRLAVELRALPSGPVSISSWETHTPRVFECLNDSAHCSVAVASMYNSQLHTCVRKCL